MQQFRNLLKGWVGKVLLTLFILPFLFVGIEGIFSTNSSQDVAITVNGTEITKIEVSRAVENQRQQLRQQMGENVNEMFLSDEILKPRIEKSLIDRELIKQATESNQMDVAPELVKSYVRSMPQFQDENGNFSPERLDMLLVQANLSKQKLFESVQEGMVIEQLQKAFGESGFITEPEFKKLVDISYQKRSLSHTTFKAKDFEDEVELSDDEVKAYYDEHKAEYKTPEEVKIDYISLDSKSVSDDVTVPDEEIRAQYDAYVEANQALERRRSSHILVEVNDDRSDKEALTRIKKAKSALEDGTDFETLVSEYSDDFATVADGGDLDFAGKGIYDEAFENALFELSAVGDVSDIVKTEYGYHLIKLTDIEGEAIKPYDAMKPELEIQAKQRLIQEKLDEMVDELGRLAYESGDLQVISETYDLDIQSTKFFSRRGGEGISKQQPIIQAAFSDNVLKDRRNSDVLALDNGQYVVLHLNEYQPSRDMDFNEVDQRIRNTLTQRKASELAMAKADSVMEKIKQGASLAEVSTEFNFSWNNNKNVARQTSALPRNLVAKVFEMPQPSESTPSVAKIEVPNGDVSVVSLNEVIPGTLELEDKERLQARIATAQQQGSKEFELFIASLREEAEIERF